MRRASPLALLDDTDDSRAVRIARADGNWDQLPYPELAERARRCATGLIAAGLAPGALVVVIGRARPEFLTTLLGAWRAGLTVSVAPPPAGALAPDPAVDHRVQDSIARLRPDAVVVEEDLAAWAAAIAPPGTRLLRHADLLADGDRPGRPDARPPAALALVQFSSGSSGAPRGVRIPFEALHANLAAIREWLRAGPDDQWASWLPVHHDMGLVGCVLAPLAGRNSFALMSPRDFLRTPERFLGCFGGSVPGIAATITATPSFGLAHLARRIRPEHLTGLDFSGWASIVVGAERIDPATLDDVHALLGPYGLARTALLPAYGLAEATLAVTGVRPGRPWRVRAAGRERVVGCGPPVPGMSVRVLDERGVAVPPGTLGEIEIAGSSLGAGYLDGHADDPFARGRLRTGDMGFVADGELFVLGRIGDSLKIRGRPLFAEDLELRLSALGWPAHRYAVVLGHRAGTPTVVAVLEEATGTDAARAAHLLAPYRGDCRITVSSVPAGFIPRTSSGKRRRRALWLALSDNQPAEELR